MANEKGGLPPANGDGTSPEKGQSVVQVQDEGTSESVFNFDDYWLARGKTFADNTLSTLTKRMQSFITFLNGLLGASFIGGVGLVGYLDTSNWLVFVLIVLPLVVVLIARYKIGIVISSPTYKNPDLRSPLQINTAFNSIVDSKRKQLVRAQSWVAAALTGFCLFIPTGIYAHNYFKAQKVLEEKEALKKSHIEITTLNNAFQVSGLLTQTEGITLLIRGKKEVVERNGEEQQKVIKDTLLSLNRAVNKGHLFEYNYEYEKFGFDLKSVGVKYAEGKVRKTIEKKL